VIVSLDRGDSLRRSLQTLAGSPHQIVVVDNGSRDGSAELSIEFPSVRFSKLPRNFGLTKALNIGLRACDGEYLLCLHDDVRISPEDVARLADYLESHPEAGVVSPALVTADDLPAPQVRELPTPADPDPVFAPAKRLSSNEPGSVATAPCILGAAIMFRSFFLKALRQIDEHYGTYGSDIEICYQVKHSAKKVVILGDATAVHLALPSPVYTNELEGDRVAGTAVFLGKHYGLAAGLLYRFKAALRALFTFRFSALAGAIAGQKIDGNS
jgi:GT2 family glycosyltransferase